MSNLEIRVGLTNIVKRFAYHCFIKHGLGRHKIEDNPHYDEVEVEELYAWSPNPLNPDEYGGGVRVSLFKNKNRCRFVEFSLRFSGGGGDDILKLVE